MKNDIQTGHYINGQWHHGQGRPLHSINPANQQVLWRGAHATPDELKMASDAAHHAGSQWSRLTFSDRAHYVSKFSKQVEIKQQALAELISLETGKPRWEALTEAAAVIGKINISITAFQERTVDKETSSGDSTSRIRYKPHGVVTVLGPFNFPAHLSNGHIVPALLAGNTIIYKPSELTPAVANFILQCWHDSGLPAGVINGVQGDSDTAKHLLNQDIQAVYFTGSYQTGLKINQHFSDRPDIILALEMGGNNPLVLGDVSNIPASVYNTILSSFITAGQRCSCARRIIIPDNARGDSFLEQFIKATSTLTIGAFDNNPEPFMGPVITHHHALTHLNAQKKLNNLGGQCLLTMRLLEDNSSFLSPGIMDMTNVANPIDEEIFAPFVQLYRYSDFNDAIRLANQTKYGLAASLLSDSSEQYEHFYQTIRAGLINWNKPTTGAASNLPFGGIGRSGNHRPSAYFAADYCAYPIASLQQDTLSIPTQKLPGIEV